MSDIVFILGAGASKEAGAPLMGEFLDVSEHLYRLRRFALVDQDQQDFELVFRGIAALQPVFAKAVIDTDNIEAVFAAFEMAALFGALSELPAADVVRLPHAIRKVITRTIEESTVFPVRPIGPEGQRGLAPPRPYGEFAEHIKRIRESRMSAAVMTFNYDIAVDFAFWQAGLPIDYALTEQQSSPALDLLKLHGSLNWRICSGCRQPHAWSIADHLRAWDYATAIRGDREVKIPVASRLSSFTHCGQATAVAEALIVPPTWSKTSHYASIASVWKRAASHLASARDIVVIGYSLPETDQFFRYLYALGTVSPTRLRNFIVLDTDSTGQVKARFERLLGPVAQRRFVYLQDSFANSLNRVIQMCTS